jgi:hypothetical protein
MKIGWINLVLHIYKPEFDLTIGHPQTPASPEGYGGRQMIKS